MENKKGITLKVEVTNIDEFKDVIYFYICMLEDSRIDRGIREQYYKSCKFIEDNFLVRLE